MENAYNSIGYHKYITKHMNSIIRYKSTGRKKLEEGNQYKSQNI